MGPRIFISYSHKNQQQLKLIVQILKRALNADIWYDNHLEGGTSFRGDIESQIAERDFFVFLASEDSFQSTFCRKELSFAMETEKPVLPIFIEDCRIPGGQGFRLALTEEHQIHMYRMTEAELEDRLLHSILAKPAGGPSSSGSLTKLSSSLKPPLNKADRQQLYLKIEEALENEEFEDVTRFIGLPEVNPLFRRADRTELGRLYLFLLWAERELVPSETDDFSGRLTEPFSGRN